MSQRIVRCTHVIAIAALVCFAAAPGALRAQPDTGPFTLERTLGRGMVRAVAWSPAGDVIAVGGALGIWLYTPALGDIGLLKGHTRAVYGLAFSPDGSKLASASHDRAVRVWDVAAQAPLLTLEGHTGLVVSVAWSPAGDVIASGAYDGTVRLWDAATGVPLQVLSGPASPISAVVFSPDEGGAVAGASYDGTIWVWHVRRAEVVAILRGHAGPILALDWPRAGPLISGGFDRTLRGWDILSATEAWSFSTTHTGAISVLASSPTGMTIATASWDGTVRNWYTRDWREVGVFSAHTGTVNQIAWAPDGTRLVTLGWDDTVRVWSVTEDREIAWRDDHLDFITALAWIGDEVHVQTGDGRRVAFDTATGAAIGAGLAAGQEPLPAALAESGGRRIALGDDGIVRVLDAATGAAIAELPGLANAAVWRADGSRVAVALRNGTVAIWKAE